MVLESTIVCVDNSEYSRNGDFAPSRFVSGDVIEQFLSSQCCGFRRPNCALRSLSLM